MGARLEHLIDCITAVAQFDGIYHRFSPEVSATRQVRIHTFMMLTQFLPISTRISDAQSGAVGRSRVTSDRFSGGANSLVPLSAP